MKLKCPLCSNGGTEIFSTIILGKYNVKYYQCENCALVYTETPYWLKEAYNSALADTDTGVMTRNVINAIKVSAIIDTCFTTCINFLDYGGGYGFFPRLMRDHGYDYKWYDLYAEPLVMKGFEWDKETKVQCLTSFEVFEHYDKPMDEIEKLASITDNIIFSTVCYDAERKWKEPSWWYYSQESGQHISIYSEYTLRYVAQQLGMNYYKLLDLYIFSKHKIPWYKAMLARIEYYSKWSHLKWISRLNFKNSSKDMNLLKKSIREKHEKNVV